MTHEPSGSGRTATRPRLCVWAVALLALLTACGPELAPGTLRVSPLPPPDVDPSDGFGGRALLEARAPVEVGVFHLELFQGTALTLRREIGRLPLSPPVRITLATETTEGAGSLRVEVESVDGDGAADGAGDAASFACALPEEMPATGPGLTSPILLRDPLVLSADELAPLFGIRRGRKLAFTGPEGPFSADETVLRVVVGLL